MKFTHLLITRFAYNEDYPFFDERVRLFNKYTLPSVRNQTCQNFQWILIVKNINEPPFGNFIKATSIKEVTENIKSNWLITSRVDNDDVLHPEYISDIQHSFKYQEFAIDFPGYRLNTQTKEFKAFDLYNKTKQSPFVSVVQRTENAGKGVMQWKHGEIHEHMPVKIIKKRRWCQIIHDHNKLMNWEDSNPNLYTDTTEKVWF